MNWVNRIFVVLALLLVLPSCHGREGKSRQERDYDAFIHGVVERIRDYRPPALLAGWQPDCLGRLAFALPAGAEWALDKPDERSRYSSAAFPDGVKGEGKPRLAWEYNEVLVSQPLTDADLAAYRKYNRENTKEWLSVPRRMQEWIEDIKREEREYRASTGIISPSFQDEIKGVEKRLEEARNWRRLEPALGLENEPDAYATDDGSGEIVIRLLRGGRLYTVVRSHRQLREGNPERDKLLAGLKDFVSRLRVRAPGEVPTEPGICIPHGFIADDGHGDYQTLATVRFPDHPGVTYTINTGLKHASDADGTATLPMPAPLKVYAYLGSIKSALTGQARNVKAITPRGARIGPYGADQGGFSLNAAKPGEPEIRTYQVFTGEEGFNGEESSDRWQIWPFVHITMDSKTRAQVPGLKEDPPPQEQSEAMLARWLPSFQLRPTVPVTDEFERRLKEFAPRPESK